MQGLIIWYEFFLPHDIYSILSCSNIWMNEKILLLVCQKSIKNDNYNIDDIFLWRHIYIQNRSVKHRPNLDHNIFLSNSTRY